MAIDKKQQQLLLIGLGVAGIGAAWYFSRGKGGAAQSDSSSGASSGAPSAIPIPALLASSGQRSDATSFAPSSGLPVSPVVVQPTPTPASPMPDFSKAYGITDSLSRLTGRSDAQAIYSTYGRLDTVTDTLIPSYVTSPATLIEHYQALSQNPTYAGMAAQFQQRIRGIQTQAGIA